MHSGHIFYRLSLAALLFVLVALPATAQAGKKVALVIGNSNYEHVPHLRNPMNDAADMGTELGTLGFEVIEVIDGTESQMDEAVESFRVKLAGAEAGLFYYAGHGVQSQGANYLIPVDADINADYQLHAKTLDASMVIDAMNASGCPLNIVILDACRDNPFGSMRSMSRGLSVMRTALAGAIIVYATDPGKAALDGIGRNGVFTQALLHHLEDPGIDVKVMFDRVGAEVAKATGNEQNPWISSKFYGTYYLAGAPSSAVATPPARTAFLTVMKDPDYAPRFSVFLVNSQGALYRTVIDEYGTMIPMDDGQSRLRFKDTESGWWAEFNIDLKQGYRYEIYPRFLIPLKQHDALRDVAGVLPKWVLDDENNKVDAENEKEVKLNEQRKTWTIHCLTDGSTAILTFK